MSQKSNKATKPTHISKGNVLDDLGLSPELTVAVKMKSDLFNKIISIIEKRKYTSRQLERLFDKPQPRVSELLNGKLSKLSIEKLLEYLECLGGEVSIKVKVKKAA